MTQFNVRGGAKWRKAYDKVRAKKRAKYECPSCGKKAVRRVAAGIWECKSCGARIAGGSFELETPTGKLSKRLISDLSNQRKLAVEEIEQEIEDEEAA